MLWVLKDVMTPLLDIKLSLKSSYRRRWPLPPHMDKLSCGLAAMAGFQSHPFGSPRDEKGRWEIQAKGYEKAIKELKEVIRWVSYLSNI